AEATPERAAQKSADIRGSDAAARGWTEKDFPRVQKLAEGVFSYEWLRPADMGGTTNCVIVVGQDGVLVGDGLATVADTKRMVDEIAKITPLPIKWVVVGSDHGDHRGGDSAFPKDAKFYASTFSNDILKTNAKSAKPADPAVRVADVVVDDTLG